MGRSKRAGTSHGGAQGAPGAAPAVAPGAQFSTAGHIDTGRRRASRNGAVVFAIVVFAVAFGLVLAAAQALLGGIGLGALVAAAIVGWLASSSIHIVLEWEKAVVLRLGKFNRVAGPGVVFTWPIVEFYTLRVDQRVSATYFGAEETLTGDIVLPKELQEAMAQEAVAERKKSARMVLAEAEKDISEMLMDASEVYAGDADAMKLRTMHLAYESVEKSGGTLVVPSAFSERT